MAEKAPHLLIVEARFYNDLADELLDSAKSVLDNYGATYEIITVPGALEIAAMISMTIHRYRIETNTQNNDKKILPRWQSSYDGYVALGTVIRGETYHFEIVANESSRALSDLSINFCLPIGNGILTVENTEQAWVRADKSKGNKGGFAANSALVMIENRKNLTISNF